MASDRVSSAACITLSLQHSTARKPLKIPFLFDQLSEWLNEQAFSKFSLKDIPPSPIFQRCFFCVCCRMLVGLCSANCGWLSQSPARICFKSAGRSGSRVSGWIKARKHPGTNRLSFANSHLVLCCWAAELMLLRVSKQTVQFA
jgi:hypothetical protein